MEQQAQTETPNTAPVAAPVTEQTQEQETAPQETNEVGREFVEFKDPDVEKRFKRVYANMKEFERANQALIEQNEKLAQKLETVVTKVDRNEYEETIDTIEKQIQEAHNDGDMGKVTKLTRQLTDITLESKMKALVPKQEVKPQVQQPVIPEKDQAVYQRWAFEVDDTGNVVRPWTLPGHPQHELARKIAEEVGSREDSKYLPIEDILREVDAKMTQVRQGNQAPKSRVGTVLPGTNLPSRAGNGKINLSDQEKAIARKLFPTLDQKKAEEKYSKQKSLLGN